MVFVVEGDVTCSELFGALSVVAAMTGVFAYPQEVVESDGAHITDGAYLGRRGLSSEFDQVFNEAYGDGELVLCGGVLSSVSFDLAFDL